MQALTLLLLATLLALTGCGPSRSRDGQRDLPPGVRVFHDDSRSVTCWLYQGGNQGGLSCIPDSQLDPRTQVGAKIPASTPTPRRLREGLQL